MAYVQLNVKAPPGSKYNTPQAMKQVDNTLTQSFPAMMKCPPPSGLPIQEADGTWELRVLVPELVGIVKNVLTENFGLEIVHEETIN